MQRLYLTSVSFKGLQEFVGKPLNTLKAAFIPTAADPYENKWFIDEDRKTFKEMGIDFFELDLKDKNENELRDILKYVDMVYVAGGNTFYLLEKVRESGFDRVIKDLVEKGVIYIGASAGAVLACKNIEPVKCMDDPSKAPNLKSYEGLGFVDFVIIPHDQRPKYVDAIDKVMNEYKDKFKLVPITDSQVVIVEGDSYKIISI